MFSRRKATKRFNLLLLEEEEYYVADWVASCKWPSSIPGNWQGTQSLPGRLRLCTKSLFFDPDDVRVPIVRQVLPCPGGRTAAAAAACAGPRHTLQQQPVRPPFVLVLSPCMKAPGLLPVQVPPAPSELLRGACSDNSCCCFSCITATITVVLHNNRLEFAAVVHMDAESMQSCVVGVNKVTQMKANMADEPYTVIKGKTSTWVFTLAYAKLDSFMPLAQEQLVMSRLPTADRYKTRACACKQSGIVCDFLWKPSHRPCAFKCFAA